MGQFDKQVVLESSGAIWGVELIQYLTERARKLRTLGGCRSEREAAVKVHDRFGPVAPRSARQSAEKLVDPVCSLALQA
jgi:hypothetical protein